MSAACPFCGASYPETVECEERFAIAIAREFEDPAFGEVHHLTVAAYMLQHNSYSRDGWLWSRALLDEFVHGGLHPAAARRKYGAQVAGGNRDWSITRGPTFERFAEITWTRTIADIRFDDAVIYCTDVRTWAEAVLADSAAVVA